MPPAGSTMGTNFNQTMYAKLMEYEQNEINLKLEIQALKRELAEVKLNYAIQAMKDTANELSTIKDLLLEQKQQKSVNHIISNNDKADKSFQTELQKSTQLEDNAVEVSNNKEKFPIEANSIQMNQVDEVREPEPKSLNNQDSRALSSDEFVFNPEDFDEDEETALQIVIDQEIQKSQEQERNNNCLSNGSINNKINESFEANNFQSDEIHNRENIGGLSINNNNSNEFQCKPSPTQQKMNNFNGFEKKAPKLYSLFESQTNIKKSPIKQISSDQKEPNTGNQTFNGNSKSFQSELDKQNVISNSFEELSMKNGFFKPSQLIPAKQTPAKSSFLFQSSSSSFQPTPPERKEQQSDYKNKTITSSSLMADLQKRKFEEVSPFPNKNLNGQIKPNPINLTPINKSQAPPPFSAPKQPFAFKTANLNLLNSSPSDLPPNFNKFRSFTSHQSRKTGNHRNIAADIGNFIEDDDMEAI